MIVSTELDEVIELADRIAVLYKGKLVGIVPAGTGRDVLGLMMAGLSPQDALADAASKQAAPHPGEVPAEQPAENAAENRQTNQAPTAQPVQEPRSGAVGDDHE
jgi:simple sugar transport system ATP-binding protein